MRAKPQSLAPAEARSASPRPRPPAPRRCGLRATTAVPLTRLTVLISQDDNAEVRRRGWAKTILFALFFQPAAVDFSPLNGFTWNEGCAASAPEIGPGRL